MSILPKLENPEKKSISMRVQGWPLCTVKRTLVLVARSSESIFSIRMLLEWRC